MQVIVSEVQQLPLATDVHAAGVAVDLSICEEQASEASEEHV